MALRPGHAVRRSATTTRPPPVSTCQVSSSMPAQIANTAAHIGSEHMITADAVAGT